MDNNIEQRICLKFCIENGILCAESLKMLQKAYDELTLSKTRTYEWYSAFKSGRDVVEDFHGTFLTECIPVKRYIFFYIIFVMHAFNNTYIIITFKVRIQKSIHLN